MNEPEFEAWNVSEHKFPREGNNVDKLCFLLKYAILAPSGHNTQPWLFKIANNDDAIELYADRTRALAVVDPEDRELTISCGAALCYLQIAIMHFGFRYKTELLPKSESEDHDLLARVSIEDMSNSRSIIKPSEEDSSVFQAITKRRTNRLKFEDRKVETSMLTRLQSIVDENGEESTWLYLAKEGDQKRRIVFRCQINTLGAN